VISRSYLDHKNKRITVERKYTMGKRRKPTDPVEIQRRRLEEAKRQRSDPSTWGPNLDTLAQADVADVPPNRTQVRRIQRFDCFALMASRCDDQADRERLNTANRYVRRYQDDVATLHRSAGVSGEGVVVDFAKPDREFANIAAGERLRAVEPLMGALTAKLMRTLSEAAIGTAGRQWRAIVESVTGERNHAAQGALIRAAMHNTAAAYQEIDNAGQRRAG
jgi:hypothetical protein